MAAQATTSDDGTMSNETDTAAPEREPSPETPPHRELVRPRDTRVLAGVASGLAEHWGVGPGWIRVAFLVTSIFGGFGLLLYLGLWIILPSDDGTESVLESAVRKAREGESWIGIGLITVAIVIGISSISWIDTSLAWAVALLVVGYLLYQGSPIFPAPTPRPTDQMVAPERSGVSPAGSAGGATTVTPGSPRAPRPPRPPRPKKPPTILGRLAVAAAFMAIGTLALVDAGTAEIRPRHYVGALLGVIALTLIVGAWFGRARWLIVVGVLLLPVAALTHVSELDFDAAFADFSRQVVVIDTIEELDRPYTFDVAEVTFDLSELDGAAVGELQVTVDVGEVVVILPEGVAARVQADVGLGAIDLGNQSSDGFEPSLSTDFAGAGGPLDVQVDVGIGSIVVYTDGRN